MVAGAQSAQLVRAPLECALAYPRRVSHRVGSAALGVLDVIDEDNLQANSKAMGARVKSGLEKLKASHRLIGDVRGMGLMLGLEIVSDRGTKAPGKTETAEVLEATRELGLLIGKGGLDGNILRIQPPMCITSDDVDFALDVFDQAFSSVEKKG